MVSHKHMDGADTRFDTISVPLFNDPMGKCLILIIMVTYQSDSEDSRWYYKQVSEFWPDVDPDGDYIYYKSD